MLTAFQQVEDELIALRMLAQQEALDRKASLAADDGERIVFNQYKTGTASITDLWAAQQTALTARRTVVAVQGERLVAAVTLIEALGGGWTDAQLPDKARIEADNPLDFSPFPPRLK